LTVRLDLPEESTFEVLHSRAGQWPSSQLFYIGGKKVFVNLDLNQNHVDNHKNSMAGTTLIIELNQGDKVQV
jgi:hypothetical protein